MSLWIHFQWFRDCRHYFRCYLYFWVWHCVLVHMSPEVAMEMSHTHCKHCA